MEYAVWTDLTKPNCTSRSCVRYAPANFNPSKPIELVEQLWGKDHYFKQGGIIDKAFECILL